MNRRVLVVGAIAVAVALGVVTVLVVRQQQHAADVARRHAVAAALARAEHEVAPAFQALDAVPTHFTNMGFYVNTLTATEEAAPLLSQLSNGHASVARARKIVQSVPTTEPVWLYLRGLDELDDALDAFEEFVPVGTALGDTYQHAYPEVSAQRDIGPRGYARSEGSMRAALKSDYNRLRGARLQVLARQQLTEAMNLARAQETP